MSVIFQAACNIRRRTRYLFKGPTSVQLMSPAFLQVPPELKDDLILIADKIEPYLQQVKDQADKIPEKAHELAAKIQPAAERLGDKIEQGAHKVTSCFNKSMYYLIYLLEIVFRNPFPLPVCKGSYLSGDNIP